MATAAPPTDADIEELAQRFEKWLNKKLAAPDEELMFANYILSIVTDEDSSDDDKLESIQPLIQELNQNEQFEDEDKLCREIIETWNKMKQDEELDKQNGIVKIKQTGENPTDTILSMINKHKSQVDTKKSLTSQHNSSSKECDYAADFYASDKDEDSNDEENKKSGDLLENTNAQDAKNKERLNREKIAEAHAKQKEQSKKALIDQKEKEIEAKKKKQAKVAKVERKR